MSNEKRLLRDDEIEALPPPRWLIQDIIQERAVVLLYGEPGCGKSFLAVDWSFCVQLGEPWAGRRTTQGDVVYVAAEGAFGLGGRSRAWKGKHGRSGRVGVWFHPDIVKLGDPNDVYAFNASIRARAIHPVLIIIDTLARAIGGEDENGRGMQAAMEGADQIRKELKCAVLLLHHPGKKGKDERGHGSLRGAVDASFRIIEQGHLSAPKPVTLECDKQKDAAILPPIKLRLEPFGGGESCVMVTRETAAERDRKTEDEDVSPLQDKQQSALDAIKAMTKQPGQGNVIRLKEWRKRTGIAERTFRRIVDDLIERGLVRRLRKGIYGLTEGSEARAA